MICLGRRGWRCWPLACCLSICLLAAVGCGGGGGTSCPDDDGDGVCNKDDKCASGDDKVDADSDGTPDACDRCPNDANKTSPGACGCGNPDTDSDSDGTPDCSDDCPDDPNKIRPDACGCGVADTDSDSDGMPDCDDECDDDPNKTEPGTCGCGQPEDSTDTDSDGTPDCVDQCDDDANKTEPGICGCGEVDDSTDSDSDGTPDCVDGCPADPNKTASGACGCGQPETDSDSDGAPDCVDGCPSDPNKTEPQVCGCGEAETDSDNDQIPDCVDTCPNDPGEDPDGDGACGTDDCAPMNPNAYPGAPDVCNHKDDDCDGVTDNGVCVIGCADAEREGFLNATEHPTIAACSGGWSVRGVIDTFEPACGYQAGDDGPNPNGTGCSVADLCAPGWHVCDSAADVEASSPGYGCAGATPAGQQNLFFTTRQSGPGNYMCDSTNWNDLYGCGDLGIDYPDANTCEPLNCASGNLCRFPGVPNLDTPWHCRFDGTDEDGQREAINVTKTGPENGGVLCCRDVVDCTGADDDGDDIPNSCDPCPADADNDVDGDGLCAGEDNCPQAHNPGQTDANGDGAGDVCDDDDDGDGSPDGDDCAPLNPDVYPGANEVCNGLDDDCDGEPDDGGGTCRCSVQPVEGHAYMLCDGLATWAEASDLCDDYPGYTMAQVDDEQENDALWSLITGSLGNVDTWLGLTDVAVEGSWVWDSGEAMTYENFGTGHPNTTPGNTDDCVAWRQDLAGQWHDLACDATHAYVCESVCGGQPDTDHDGYADACDCAPLNPNIHPGSEEICNGKDDNCDGQRDEGVCRGCTSEEHNGSYYLFCPQGTNWQNALDTCLSMGYHLVSIQNRAENAWCIEWITSLYHPDLPPVHVWHGFNYRALERSWVWEDGSLVTHVSWNNGEPNNSGVENCAHFYTRDSLAGLWNDIRCVEQMPFVCETDPCPHDLENDIDGDGICGNEDTCPGAYNPDQNPMACAGRPSCQEILNAGESRGDGTYWIAWGPSGVPVQVYCDMTTQGGGWTLVTVYGTDGRPSKWSGNDYPRPGASFYGRLDLAVLDPANNTVGISNYSIDAKDLWDASGKEVLAYVGGNTDDYVYGTLPDGCNYFDGSTWCLENTYGPFTLYRSDGSVLTDDAYACTTAHRQGNFGPDRYDEFGLHLLDGQDDSSSHCHRTPSSLGHQSIGRIFTSFENSAGDYWENAVHSHFNETEDFNVPGALFIR